MRSWTQAVLVLISGVEILNIWKCPILHILWISPRIYVLAILGYFNIRSFLLHIMFIVFVCIYDRYYSWLKISDIFPSDDNILSEKKNNLIIQIKYFAEGNKKKKKNSVKSTFFSLHGVKCLFFSHFLQSYQFFYIKLFQVSWHW